MLVLIWNLPVMDLHIIAILSPLQLYCTQRDSRAHTKKYQPLEKIAFIASGDANSLPSPGEKSLYAVNASTPTTKTINTATVMRLKIF